MNRRTLLTLAPAAAAGFAIAPHATRAQATPVSEPALPVAYADVADLYEAARDRALTQGREISDQVFGGELAAVYQRASPDLQAAVDLATLETGLQALTVNRVSFAADPLGFFFDGELTGDTISGFMVSDIPYGFSITRTNAAGTPIASSPVASPAAVAGYTGSWSGQLDLGGQLIDMTVELGTTDGVLSLPDLGVTDVPLSGIAFDAERPIGERLTDQGVPLGRELDGYWARYAWGDRTLSLTTAEAADGTIAQLQIAPEPQLPPDPAAGYVSEVRYRLPFEGLWWVYWGGDRPLENYHSIDRRQRHAVDLLIWNDGATYRTDGASNADYWVYGQPVLAPADGVVAEIQDGIAENDPGSTLPDVHPGGNHVTIQTAPEEFVLLGHLQTGSVQVAKGDTVTAGQVIGLAGNSGNSSEPHLHIHMQNEPDFFSPTAMGLPLVFSGLKVNGKSMETASLERGSFVNPS